VQELRAVNEVETIAACALADALALDGEVLVTAIGDIPKYAARLAQCTSAPDLMCSDGNGHLVWVDRDGRTIIEGSMPFRNVFDVALSGRRHVIMGAAQLDAHGNQNIAAIGDWRRPTAQLLGLRGGPGNGINHAVSYWIPAHSVRVFVPTVDVVSAPGTDRFAPDNPSGRFVDPRVVVTNLAVLDFRGPGRRMQVCSLHPGVEPDQVIAATGFPLTFSPTLHTTRLPSPDELSLLLAAGASV
jgi:acyl CoA:acetate/3-ketoacid CoA transferase beta subunit